MQSLVSKVLWWLSRCSRALVCDALGGMSTQQVAVVFIREQVQGAARLLTGRCPAWEVRFVLLCSGVVASRPVRQAV